MKTKISILVILAWFFSCLWVEGQTVQFNNGTNVSFTGFEQGVTSISLAFEIDTTKYGFIDEGGVTNLSTSMDSGFYQVHRFTNMIIYGWFSVYGPIHINGEAIRFNLTENSPGCSSLTWVNNNTACAISDPQYQIYSTVFADGIICNNLENIVGEFYYKESMVPIPGTIAQLRGEDGDIIKEQETINGSFVFDSVPAGNYYTVTAYNTICPTGGINSTDALYAAKYFTHQVLLEELQIQAADVNSSGGVNSTDALNILKKFVFGIPFPNQWIFEPIPVSPQSTFYIGKGICVGDVDGSYVP